MSKSVRKQDRRGHYHRPPPVRELRQRFLIVCEGEKTEPNYFRAYRQFASVFDVHIHGASADPLSVVNRASDEVKRERQRQGLSIKKKPYDQVWCVFDRDSWPTQRFNEALAQAEQREFKVAYSNQAFELWYVLHFEYLNSSIPRADYIHKLHILLGEPYVKNSWLMFAKLQSRQQTALKNAERLFGQYAPVSPANDDPSTTVHHLIQQLNRFTL
jgi:hypothetical protein